MYDTLPGLGNAFTIGSRAIPELQPIDTINRQHLPKPAAPPAPSAAVTTSAEAISASAADALPHGTTFPAPDKPAEQFISVPDSPKASAAVVSPVPARPFSRTNADDVGEPSSSGQDLPWNQASAYINSPLLRLHTGQTAPSSSTRLRMLRASYSAYALQMTGTDCNFMDNLCS